MSRSGGVPVPVPEPVRRRLAGLGGRYVPVATPGLVCVKKFSMTETFCGDLVTNLDPRRRDAVRPPDGIDAIPLQDRQYILFGTIRLDMTKLKRSGNSHNVSLKMHVR
jgi:hypothetical protein